jgi:hypothetical protein
MNCFCHTMVTETAFCIQSSIVMRFILLNLMVTVCYANVFGSDWDGGKFPTEEIKVVQNDEKVNKAGL